jgi:hypothetical protein
VVSVEINLAVEKIADEEVFAVAKIEAAEAFEVEVAAAVAVEAEEEVEVVEVLVILVSRHYYYFIEFDLFVECLEREFQTDSIYVGQLPAEMQESDVKKLFPKAATISVTAAEGSRPGLVPCFL